MHPLLALLGSTPALDEDTADRLLSGRLDPADTPSAYAPVARLVKAATGPAAPEELAGEAAMIAAFKAHAHPRTLVPRRASMPSKLLSVKAAAAMIAAVLSVGGVAAAATGMLPGRAAQQATDHASSAAGGGSAAQAHGSGQGAAKGPDATGSAKDGLCQAWQSGQGGSNGKREDSTAFQALAAAAGGADKVDAYCQTATTAGHAANGPDATGAAKDGLCKAWEAAQSGQGTANGKRQDPAAFQALATAAGGADKVAAYCQTATTAAASDHGQGQGQSSGGASQANSNGSDNGQGGPPTTTG